MMSEESSSLEEFQKIIKKEKNLPQNIGKSLVTFRSKVMIISYLLDNVLLRRFLNVYDNNDLKKSLELLKYNLVTRKNGSYIFFNRDPLSDATQIATKTA